MMIYLYMVIGAALGAGVGLAVAALKKERRPDDNPFGRASLIGAIVGGVLAAIVFNAISLGYKHSEHVIEIKSEEQFEKIVLQSDKPVLVDFYASGCGPCIQMTPIIAEIADEGVTPEGKRYVVVKVEVNANGAWVRKYFLKNGVPHFVVYKNGQAVAETGGAQAKEKIVNMLEPHIK